MDCHNSPQVDRSLHSDLTVHMETGRYALTQQSTGRQVATPCHNSPQVDRSLHSDTTVNR